MAITDQTDKEKFIDLIKDIKVAVLFTHSPDDGLRGRPMQTAKMSENGELWFFTNEFSGKVDEISRNHEVVLSYAKPSDNVYVIVNGQASVHDDREMIKALWNPALKAWFPEGTDDPRIALLKVVPDQVEYWSGSSSKIVLAFNMLKAIVKGEEYRDGEHEKLNMNQ